jgi:hypothetical protein
MRTGWPGFCGPVHQSGSSGRVSALSGGGSSRSPLAIILSMVSGNGRWSADASSHGARIHTSHSSCVVRITGMVFGWIGSTTAFGAVVRSHEGSPALLDVTAAPSE